MPTVCKGLCSNDPFPCLESKEIIVNKKGIKMVVSSSTRALLGRCTAGDRGTGMVVMEGPCHIAAIYVAPKANYTYSLLGTREMSGLKKKGYP